MMLASVVSTIVLIAGVVGFALLFRSKRSESPEEILKRRYARGEISREEYEQRMAELRR